MTPHSLAESGLKQAIQFLQEANEQDAERIKLITGKIADRQRTIEALKKEIEKSESHT